MRRTRPYLAGAIALAAAACPAVLQGQIPEAEGGARLDGGLAFRLELDDGDTEFRTGFDLDLITATRIQRLGFSGDFGVTVPFDDLGATDLSDPRYQLFYLRDNGRSRLSAVLSLASSDVDGTIFDPENEFDEIDLIDDDGTREVRSLALGMELGLTDPIGGSLRYERREIVYDGTSDPDLTDSRSEEVAATLRFDVDQTLRYTFDASARRTEEEDIFSTETETFRAGLGVGWQTRPDLRIDGRLGWSEITQTSFILGFPVVTVIDGSELALGLTLDRRNGTWALNYDRDLTDIGAQDTLRLTRALALPRGAAVNASLGARQMPNGEVYAIGSFDYGRATRRGDIDVSLSHEAVINSDDDEVLRSRIQASYGEDLPAGASWSVDGTLVESDYTDPALADVFAAQLSLNYAMPLTRDWDLNSGIRVRETREEGASAEQDTTLFLSLERRFSWRP